MMSQGSDLITIAVVTTELESQLIVAALADEGIEAIAFPLSSNVLPMGLPARPRANGVPVQVRPDDASRATTIIARLRDGGLTGGGVDWEAVDVGDRADQMPLSGEMRMPLLARIAVVLAIVLLLASLAVGLALTFSPPAADPVQPENSKADSDEASTPAPPE